MASRKSAAVNSSHFTESLDCAFVKVVTIRDNTRQQNVARFIGFPPTTPCILILFHAFEARHFRLDSERGGRMGISGFARNAGPSNPGLSIWNLSNGLWPAGKDAEALLDLK